MPPHRSTYLRQLEREGYIETEVITGHRSRLCTGLLVQLLRPLFPRHHAESRPAKLVIPDATQKVTEQEIHK
jgi:hypothetical protein